MDPNNLPKKRSEQVFGRLGSNVGKTSAATTLCRCSAPAAVIQHARMFHSKNTNIGDTKTCGYLLPRKRTAYTSMCIKKQRLVNLHIQFLWSNQTTASKVALTRGSPDEIYQKTCCVLNFHAS